MSYTKFTEALEASMHTQEANNKNLELALDNLDYLVPSEREKAKQLVTKVNDLIEYAQHLMDQLMENYKTEPTNNK